MNTTDLIETLKAEGRKLVIVEAGCGDALSGSILSTPGASKILQSVIIPYSKEVQDFMSKDVWGANDEIVPGTRAVSLENLKRLANIGFQHTPNIENVVVYAATFQITGIVHGWIGGFTDHGMIAVHVTLPIEGTEENRETILSGIREIAIKFNIDTDSTPFVDNYVNMHKQPGRTGIAAHEETEREEFLTTWLNSEQECEIILFKKDHTIGRAIDLDREAQEKNENIVLYRGSFNPLSAAHIKIATHKNTTLVIGANTYDKGSNSVHDMLHRIQACNDAGFDVLLCKHALFLDLAKNLRQYNFTSKIEFVVGSDTMRRIMEASGVVVDPSVPYNESVRDLSGKALQALKSFIDLDVEFTVVTRKNRAGKSYEYYVPMTTDTQLQLSNINYLEIDTDFPSSTELRESRKTEDCNFAINVFNAYLSSSQDKSFEQFVEDYHAETDTKKYTYID